MFNKSIESEQIMPSKFGFESEPSKSDLEKQAELERSADEKATQRFEEQYGELVESILKDFLATHLERLDLIKDSSSATWYAGEKLVRTGYGLTFEPDYPIRAYYRGYDNSLKVHIAQVNISDDQVEELSRVLYTQLGIDVEVTTFGTAGPRAQGIFRYPYLIGR
ncbi:MAG: hypothetical protein WDZ94_04840 [Patescibacteria group bacterium]